jgi:sulfate transport system permease protein
MPLLRRTPSILPGFPLAMTWTLVYLAVLVLAPLGAVVWKASTMPVRDFVAAVASPRALACYRLTFLAALAAALANAVFGTIVAWVLERYAFPGRRLVDAVVDLPFALPTAVSGIALATVYSEHGWIGAPLRRLGIEAAFSPVGVALALTFVGLPFVVRTVQPVLASLDRDTEEAAATLGASRIVTLARVILPELLPAILTGFTLAFARGLGEYGSVVFISGNMPFRTEIAPLLIMSKLEQFDYAGATAVGVVTLVASFLLLLASNRLAAWSRRRQGPS